MSGVLQLICVLVIISLTLGQKYSTKYDDINVDEILGNKRVLNNYIKCILDEGPCTAEGREFKNNIPEAIVTNCSKCTDAQVKIIKKTSNFIKKNRPQDWDRIRHKFDPQEKYKNSFDKFLSGN